MINSPRGRESVKGINHLTQKKHHMLNIVSNYLDSKIYNAIVIVKNNQMELAGIGITISGLVVFALGMAGKI